MFFSGANKESLIPFVIPFSDAHATLFAYQALSLTSSNATLPETSSFSILERIVTNSARVILSSGAKVSPLPFKIPFSASSSIYSAAQ